MIYRFNFNKSDGAIHVLFPKTKPCCKGTKDLFKSNINIPANTGTDGEPTTTPSVCI